MNKTDIPKAQKDVLGMLIDDHRHVLKITKDYKTEKDDAKKKSMVEDACISLIAHTEIEEEIFYPFLREQDEKTFGDMLDEALVEHASVKDLVKELRGMDPDDELYDAKVTVVGEFVEHHVKEEEDEMFKKVIDKKIDLEGLYEKMKAMKEDIEARETRG